MLTRIINVSEARQRLAELVRDLEAPLYVTVYGKPRAAIVNYEVCEVLLEWIEELEDSLAVLMRRDKPMTGWEEFEEKGAQNAT